jgi:two-component system, NtrC family, sensor kinase
MNKSLPQLLLDISLDPKIDQGDLHQASQLILTTLQQQLRVDRLSIWRHNAQHSHINCLCLLELDVFDIPSNLSLDRHSFPAYFATLEKARNIVIFNAKTELQHSALYHSYYKPLGIAAIVEAPVRHHGKVVGVICIEHRQTRQWTETEIMLVTVFADMFSRALNAAERLSYQQQLEQLNRQLEQQVSLRTEKLAMSLSTLKSTQHKMLETEKMASLGRMVAGMSHEINTPLGIAVTANSYAQATLTTLETLYLSGQLTKSSFRQSGEAMKSSINLVTNNLQRTVDLVESIKQTALEPTASAPIWLKPAHFVPQVINSLQYEIAACDLQVKVNIPADLHIQTYASTLATILRQLIENTCLHAFTQHKNRILQLSMTTVDDDWCLNLSDNGQGMTEQQLNRAFEPFYTSNRSGGSKGLGLTLVFNLVSQILQGQIQLQSNENGYSVQIICPRSLKANT